MSDESLYYFMSVLFHIYAYACVLFAVRLIIAIW